MSAPAGESLTIIDAGRPDRLSLASLGKGL